MPRSKTSGVDCPVQKGEQRHQGEYRKHNVHDGGRAALFKLVLFAGAERTYVGRRRSFDGAEGGSAETGGDPGAGALQIGRLLLDPQGGFGHAVEVHGLAHVRV